MVARGLSKIGIPLALIAATTALIVSSIAVREPPLACDPSSDPSSGCFPHFEGGTVWAPGRDAIDSPESFRVIQRPYTVPDRLLENWAITERERATPIYRPETPLAYRERRYVRHAVVAGSDIRGSGPRIDVYIMSESGHASYLLLENVWVLAYAIHPVSWFVLELTEHQSELLAAAQKVGSVFIRDTRYNPRVVRPRMFTGLRLRKPPSPSVPGYPKVTIMRRPPAQAK